MHAAVLKWQPIIFVLVFGLALSSFASHTDEDASAKQIGVTRTLPRFDREARNEYERALDLFFLTQTGTNEEFNAFEHLLGILTYKEDVDQVLKRLSRLSEEGMDEENKLRKDNLKESLERKRDELDRKPAMDDTSTVATRPVSKTLTPFVAAKRPSKPTQMGSASPIYRLPKRLLDPKEADTTVAATTPVKTPSTTVAPVTGPTTGSAPVTGANPAGFVAYNAPAVTSTTNVAELNPEPQFDDEVFNLAATRESPSRSEGLRGSVVSKDRFVANQPVRKTASTVSVTSESDQSDSVSFTPPSTDPGIMRKLTAWLNGFERTAPGETTLPTSADLQSELSPVSENPFGSEAQFPSSLQAFQAQMTAIAK